MKHWLSFFLLQVASIHLLGQDPCSLMSNRKQSAMIQEIIQQKSSDTEKLDRLQEKSEQLAENPRFQTEIGILQFKLAEQEGTNNFDPALESFQKALQLCDKVNPQVYYYLGVIHYSREQYTDALRNFKQFLTFQTNEEDKAHEAKLIDVENAIPVIEKELKQAKWKGATKDLPKPKRLTKLSTERSEYLPMLSPDNSRIYFTRKFMRANRGMATQTEVEEFSVGYRLPEDEMVFDMGIAMKPPFNQGGNYGGVTLSSTNKELYITVCLPTETGYKNCDIYYSKYVKFKSDTGAAEFRWLELKEIGDKVNTPTGWEAQPSLSPDGRTLYFSRYNKNTKETDLYYSEKDSTGTWQEALPMESINSGGHDKAPFMHQDGKTLYFASSGRGDAEGGFDIYYSVRDTLGWSKPKNIGPAVNTPADEHGMLVSSDGKYAIFAANEQEMAPYDIFYLELPEQYRPEAMVFIKGVVENSTEETRLQLKNEQGELVRELELDKEDGSYTTMLKKTELKKPLVLGIQQKGVIFEARVIDTTKVVNGLVVNDNLTVNEISADKPYTIHDINFETNSSTVKPASLPMLNEFARFLMQNPGYRVSIYGHTDNVGSTDANLSLSVDRALSVKSYLITKGVPTGRIDHKGFGDTKPMETNSTEAGRSKNRRTEFVLRK